MVRDIENKVAHAGACANSVTLKISGKGFNLGGSETEPKVGPARGSERAREVESRRGHSLENNSAVDCEEYIECNGGRNSHHPYCVPAERRAMRG